MEHFENGEFFIIDVDLKGLTEKEYAIKLVRDFIEDGRSSLCRVYNAELSTHNPAARGTSIEISIKLENGNLTQKIISECQPDEVFELLTFDDAFEEIIITVDKNHSSEDTVCNWHNLTKMFKKYLFNVIVADLLYLNSEMFIIVYFTNTSITFTIKSNSIKIRSYFGTYSRELLHEHNYEMIEDSRESDEFEALILDICNFKEFKHIRKHNVKVAVKSFDDI